MRVTGGFLAGLDLEFSPGLNVIVGPRGAGKTTLLELLRHALALPAGPEARDRASLLRHALDTGEVVVDLKSETSADRLIVDLAGGGRRQDLTEDVALMLGQNELEEIADSPARRLALIDLRAGITPADQAALLERLRRTTTRAQELRNRRKDLEENARQKTSLIADINQVRQREQELLSRNEIELGPRRERLAGLEAELRSIQEATGNASRLRGGLADIAGSIAPLQELAGSLESIRIDSTAGLEAVAGLVQIERALTTANEVASSLLQTMDASLERLRLRDLELRAATEPVRTELDQIEQGLGVVTAELRDLTSQLARVESWQREIQELAEAERKLLSERDAAYAELEEFAEGLFVARTRAAQEISDQLDHRVQIVVKHYADASDFRATLARLLQGSNLKYNPLAEALANSVLPSALLRYTEKGDHASLSTASNIPLDRAARVLEYLDEADGLAEVAATMLRDAVDFKLQDGAVLKSAGQLSTGQKCAVTMPVVLTDTVRIVILDQPEDHLDNQFLVDHIVTSILSRTSAGAQTIVATHNPNIPVLGSADLVVHLSSDGTRGEVAGIGAYDDEPIVGVITTLMEGGREAFARRAQFYSSHPDR